MSRPFSEQLAETADELSAKEIQEQAEKHALEQFDKYLNRLENSIRQKNYVGALSNLSHVRIWQKSINHLIETRTIYLETKTRKTS